MVFSASVTEDGSTHHEQHPNPGAALEPEGVLASADAYIGLEPTLALKDLIIVFFA